MEMEQSPESPFELPAEKKPQPEGEKSLPESLQRILNVELPVIVVLAEKELRVRDLVKLSAGSVLEFEKTVEDFHEVLLANKRIARGEAIKVGEQFGVQIREILPVRERIKRMGPEEQSPEGGS